MDILYMNEYEKPRLFIQLRHDFFHIVNLSREPVLVPPSGHRDTVSFSFRIYHSRFFPVNHPGLFS